MMNQDNILHPNECKCISWKPIIVGALVAIGLSFLLNLFSVAIGLTAVTTNSEGVETFAMGGMLGIGIGILASMFAAGWLTGYLSKRHCTQAHLGALYGFLAWTLALLVTVFIAAQVQQYISLYGHIIAGTTDMYINAGNVSVTAAKVPTEHLVTTSYIVFALFFLSAFSCSLGGHCGARHVCCKSKCA